MIPRLDESKIKQFRELVNSSDIFLKSEKHKENWNLFCAFMDRIEDAVKVLISRDLISNDIGKPEDLIIFIVYTDIITESLKMIFSRLGLDNPLNSTSSIFNQQGYGSGTDDRFFKYIRSLSFAHVIDTTRERAYVLSGEIKYSPFVLNGSMLDVDKITIATYSNIEENDGHFIRFPKRQLIKYIESRYYLIEYLNDYLQNEILVHRDKILKEIIAVSDNPIDTLNNLRRAAISRYDDDTIRHIDRVFYTLSYDTENPVNRKSVEIFKQYVISLIDDFVKLYQALDDRADNHDFRNVFYISCNEKYNLSNYVLPKIREYLSEEIYGPNDYGFDPNIEIKANTPSNVLWGFQQLKVFKKQLSDRYVHIDYNMPFDEIQLLISTTLFLDKLQS